MVFVPSNYVLSRRSLVRAVTAAGLGLVFSRGRAFAQEPDLSGIDAHCHVFNAHDLPVRGFVQRVVFGDGEGVIILDPSAEASRQLLPWVGAVLIELLLTGGAPSADGELREIEFGLPSFVGPSEVRAGDEGIQELALALRNTLSRSVSETFSSMPALEGSASPAGGAYFVQRLFAEAGIDQHLSFTESSGELPYTELSRGLLNGDGPISRYMQWGRLLNSSRRRIVEQIVSLYSGGNRIRLFTPALVDFSAWLDDEPRSDLESQVRVMERIQRLDHGALVHCFAGYDPWREVADREAGRQGTALEIVKWAVEEMGFLGVKLYPPMGFLPAGNEGSGLPYPNRAAGIPDFAQKLDDALDRLFSWAESEGVPVMAHATNSNGAADGFSERASPRNWYPVVQKYPNLRLNLGHFGGFNETHDTARGGEDWEDLLGALIAEGTQWLYADASYLSEVLPGAVTGAEIDRLRSAWQRFVAKYDPDVDRLMFGSDWIMLGREKGCAGYFEAVDSFVTSAGLTGERRRRFFGSNAARYLGLRPGEPARRRLQSYYISRNLDATQLDVFNVS